MGKEHRVSRKSVPEMQISVGQQVETQQLHCIGCGRFLGFFAIVWGALKIKCPRCKEWTIIDIQPQK